MSELRFVCFFFLALLLPPATVVSNCIKLNIFVFIIIRFCIQLVEKNVHFIQRNCNSLSRCDSTIFSAPAS